MYNEEIKSICETAYKKIKLLKESIPKYLVHSALAGMYVGFSILLIFTIGGTLDSASLPYTKTVMGIAFGCALSFVMMAGSDLFTGNNMVMTISALEKRTSWKDAVSIWCMSWLGNFLGSLILVVLYYFSGLSHGTTEHLMLKFANLKMNYPFYQLFIKGILCNILVCLAVWCFYRLKTETAKLIMIFWCLFAFFTAGYEHSIANMTLLPLSLLFPHDASITWLGMAKNLTAVTLGNLVGGGLFIGWTYWYISNYKVAKQD